MESIEIHNALQVARQYGQIDGDHHKAWVIDQMVRRLLGCPLVEMVNESAVGGPLRYMGLGESEAYQKFVREYQHGEDGPETYIWDEGIAP